ncbi:hypothetical protein M409DRAFT_65821 [Zasmidium cellare ATCC 36951]|uniref:Nucleoside phosphorylase domain-containing protein n=1 Tax=Zasmidium cellare ATCC 36951 TaxID=1080233 RepID=A0A6A6CP93_ZASCE|nr:uncharacterized protein M409DRAFT_65821 [Zasmidium cellare ATCC 36951]KAF2167692.1 hypothetical protein M409DRAFT_65821 [Zasmidium cellare ATCC 36951]
MPPKRKALPHASQYTVGWIAALPHERAAASTVLDERHDKPQDFKKNPSDPNSYDWGRIGEHHVVIASLPTGEYGTVSAADTASGMRASLPHIRIGLLVGIGAGLPGEKREILLGDVVVSNPDGTNGGVVQYDLYKAKVEAGASVRERKGFLNSPPRALRIALGALRAEHEMEDSQIPEFLQAFEQNAKMKVPYGYPGSDKDPLRQPESRDTPEIHYGTIASGNVLIKDAEQRDSIIEWLGRENVHPLCYEMEAAGLMNSFPCVVIRGICDYANEHKNDDWQRYAAATAAAFAKELLQYVDTEEVEITPKIAEVLENSQ